MPTAAKLSTLIVDDQPSIRTLLRTSLRQLGIDKISECCDGEEAWNVLRAYQPDLVISDVNMPKMDGVALLRAVRGNPPTAKMAFIMLTSRAEAKLVQDAIALGVNNYIVKPFTFGALKKKIEAVIGPLT